MHGMKDGCLLVPLLLASLIVDAGGFFISQKSATKVVNDETFIVVCRDDVSGRPIIWHGPKGLVLGPKTRPEVHTTSYGTSIVFNSPLKPEDSGNYTCSTDKEQGVFQFLVETPLKFTDTSANQTGVEGSEFNLKCEVKGGTVSWSVEGGDIIADNHKFTVLGDGLLIKNVSRADGRTYICKGVQQSTGMVLDRKIHFHVLHKPVHPFHPPKHVKQDVVYGYVNGSVNLTCQVIANPAATFQWLKVNDKKHKTGKIINESEKISILQLQIDNSTFGDYKCIAKNTYGIYEERFTLKRGVKPLVPNDVQLTRITPTSLIFKIRGPDKTEGMELETRGFSVQYKKIDDEEWKQEEFNITQDNIYTLGNLDSDTEYVVQAATRNAAGLSDYVPPSHYKTSGAATVHPVLPLLSAIGVALLFQKISLALW